MLLPTTHQTALLLLVCAWACLGTWPSFVKLSRWRFELFYFDFSIGALLLAATAAWTLGTLGSELSFNDRIAVAGLRSQALVMAAGFVFNIGNMLLVGAIALGGMAISVPVAVAVALIVTVAAGWQGASLWMASGGIAALLVSVAAGSIAAQKRNTRKRKPGRTGTGRGTKASALAILSGILIGGSTPLAELGLWGDLGLGAYAGMLMFSLGLALSTAMFNLFLMNMGIDGGRVTFRSYFRGTLGQHGWGVSGGIVWALGVLAVMLARSVPSAVAPGLGSITLAAQGAALLTLACGLIAWKEFAGSNRATLWVALTGASFAAGLLLIAFGFSK